MLYTLLFFIPLVALAAGSDSEQTVTPNSLFSWLGVAAFLMVIANQGAIFWRNFFAQDPKSADVARDLNQLSSTLSEGIDRVELTLQERFNRFEEETKKELITLKTNMDDRFAAASASRKGIHKEADLMRERAARLEVEVENIKQRQALHEISRKQNP